MTAPLLDLATLDETHRARQAQNAVLTQRLVAQLFMAMVDPKNITGTAPRWLNQSIIAILRGRQSSWLLASAYATAVRRLQVPGAPDFEMPSPEPVSREKLIRSLMYTGPGKLAVAQAKTPEPIEPDRGLAIPEDFERYERQLEQFEQTMQELPVKAAMSASAAAYRHVADGGRDLIHRVIDQDPVAVGYMRITRPAPCGFCLAMASRGPVYREDSFDKSDPRFEGPGEAKVHDSCGCSLRPIYGGRSVKHWTELGRKAEKLWDDKIRGRYSGSAALNAFAREARELGLGDLNRWGQQNW